MKASKSQSECPLSAPDQRLQDGLNLWVEAKSRYFSPDSFRLSLNNVVQALRNVTFVLQKSKNALPGFDEWYTPWQGRMRNDQKMRWLVDSRNIIVKQGDLETHSRARISVVDSWLAEPKLEMDVPPFTESSQFEHLVASELPKDASIDVRLFKIERRWVDARMSNEEILHVLAHAFNVLSRLLYDAHMCLFEDSQRAACPWLPMVSSSKGNLPPCMLGLDWDRTLWIDLRDGSILRPRSSSRKQSQEELEIAARRYDGIEQFKKELSEATDLGSEAQAFFNQAKNLLKTDGYHVPTALLGYPDGRRAIVHLRMDDRTGKHLVLRQLAADIEKTGAISVMLINEAWLSRGGTPPASGYAVDAPNREECLNLIAADSDGQQFTHTAIFVRADDGTITITEESVSSREIINMLEPIKDAWRKRREMLEQPDPEVQSEGAPSD